MAYKLLILVSILSLAHARVIESFPSLLGARIVGGHDAKRGEFPHQVSLHFGVPSILPFEFFCGGSILNDRWILTAAHCISVLNSLPTYTFVVKAGKLVIDIIEDTEQTSIIAEYYKHELYPGELGPYDLGLLKLETPLRLTKSVAAIKLPTKGSEPQGEVILSGWGALTNNKLVATYPTILQTVNLPIIDRSICNTVVKMLTNTTRDIIHETNLCTGPLDNKISACSGDSGGPLILRNENGQTELIGVVSWGLIPCGIKQAPSVYVKVSSFIDWIENIMTKHA